MLSLLDIFNVIKFPHVIEKPSFLMATEYSTIWICSGFLKHPVNIEHLGGFQFLPGYCTSVHHFLWAFWCISL